MDRALTFIDTLERTEGIAPLLGLLEGTLASFGADYFSFTDMPQPPRYGDFLFVKHNIPDDWLRLYEQRDFGRVDPGLSMCRKTTLPFVWSEAPYDGDDADAAEFVGLMTELRLSRGVVIPVPRPRGRPGIVCIGGPDTELDPHAMASLHLVALYSFNRLREAAAGPRARSRPNLSFREREVLAWIAAGKTAWEIGEILCISKLTVDVHAKTAMAKLNAANRTEAVVIALRQGLLEL